MGNLSGKKIRLLSVLRNGWLGERREAAFSQIRNGSTTCDLSFGLKLQEHVGLSPGTVLMENDRKLWKVMDKVF